MTEVVTQTAKPLAPPPRRLRRGSLVVSGVMSAVGAGALGLLACLLIVVLGWATDPNSTGSPVTLIRATGHLWLLAHRVPLVVDGGTVAFAPLGLSALIFGCVARAASGTARRTAARSPRDTMVATLAVAPPYALLAGIVAAATGTAQVRSVPVLALALALVLAALAAVAATVRRLTWREITRGWAAPARAVPPAAAAAVVAVLATGALLVAASLIDHASRVTSIARSIQGAGPAGFALVVVQIALAPNAAIWGSAYAAGTGFAVGVGTRVAPAGVSLGAVPGLPVLGALPAGPNPAAGWLSLVGVLAAGAVGGIVLARRLGATRHHLAGLWMAVTAFSAGATFALLCWLAGGTGPGRLALLGPRPAQSAAAVAMWMALSGVPTAWVTSWRRGRRDTG